MIVLYIFLSILLGLVLFSKFRKDNTIALSDLKRKYETPNSKYLEIKGLNCHYTDEGSGPVVVLIHGLGDSFMIFEELVTLLAPNYRVIRIDLPGFGLSEIPRDFGTDEDPIDFYRSFLRTFVDELKLDKFHLMGNSLGGLVSWEFAVNNQDRLQSLCLLASAGYEMDVVKKNITKGVLNLLPRFLLKNGMPIGVARKNVAAVLNRRENRTDKFIQMHYDMTNREGVLDYLLDLIAIKDFPVTDDLKTLKTPTMIAWGDKDNIVPTRHADFFIKDIQDSQKIIYTKCGHCPQVEYATQFLEDWSQFINKNNEKI